MRGILSTLQKGVASLGQKQKNFRKEWVDGEKSNRKKTFKGRWIK